MQLQIATNVDLNKNEVDKYIYIIHFYWHPEKDENVVVFVTWKVVHRPLDTMWHLFNFIYNYKFQLQMHMYLNVEKMSWLMKLLDYMV
jgi:hypothetical protein